MIKSKLTKVSIARFPVLNTLGEKFYTQTGDIEKIKKFAGASAIEIGSISFNEDGSINNFTINDPATGDHVATIFDYYFDGDFNIVWSF